MSESRIWKQNKATEKGKETANPSKKNTQITCRLSLWLDAVLFHSTPEKNWLNDNCNFFVVFSEEPDGIFLENLCFVLYST